MSAALPQRFMTARIWLSAHPLLSRFDADRLAPQDREEAVAHDQLAAMGYTIGEPSWCLSAGVLVDEEPDHREHAITRDGVVHGIMRVYETVPEPIAAPIRAQLQGWARAWLAEEEA